MSAASQRRRHSGARDDDEALPGSWGPKRTGRRSSSRRRSRRGGGCGWLGIIVAVAFSSLFGFAAILPVSIVHHLFSSILLSNKEDEINKQQQGEEKRKDHLVVTAAAAAAAIRRSPATVAGPIDDDDDDDNNSTATKNTTTTNDDGSNNAVRLLAFVFPQFHRDEINDRLWGDNFTDWDSLRAAPTHNRLGDVIIRPTGHLGYYYDYTDPTIRQRQGRLAKQYGLDGFIYHHYWFYDPDRPGPNLHAPLEALLRDNEPDLPFALHWCASKWTSTWNGKTRPDFRTAEPGVLQKQYFPTDGADPAIDAHYRWLRRFFHHPNYVKVRGRPLLMLYVRKPGSYVVVRRLRQLAAADGFPGGLYVTVGLTKNHPHLLPISDDGVRRYKIQQINGPTRDNFDRVLAYPNPTEWNTNRTFTVPAGCAGGTMNDNNKKRMGRVLEIPGLISSFDNTPRRTVADATIWSRPTTAVTNFRTSLAAALYYESCCVDTAAAVPSPGAKSAPAARAASAAIDNGDDDDGTDRIIVINAMNEWAEGMALEPSDVYGRGFLEAIREVKLRQAVDQCQGFSPP